MSNMAYLNENTHKAGMRAAVKSTLMGHPKDLIARGLEAALKVMPTAVIDGTSNGNSRHDAIFAKAMTAAKNAARDV